MRRYPPCSTSRQAPCASCGALLWARPPTPAGRTMTHRSCRDWPPRNPAASCQNRSAGSRQAAHFPVRASGCRSLCNSAAAPHAGCCPMCCAPPSRSVKRSGTPRQAFPRSGTYSPSQPRRTSGSSPAPALHRRVPRRKWCCPLWTRSLAFCPRPGWNCRHAGAYGHVCTSSRRRSLPADLCRSAHSWYFQGSCRETAGSSVSPSAASVCLPSPRSLYSWTMARTHRTSPPAPPRAPSLSHCTQTRPPSRKASAVRGTLSSAHALLTPVYPWSMSLWASYHLLNVRKERRTPAFLSCIDYLFPISVSVVVTLLLLLM